MNMTNFTVPSFRIKQIVTTEGNKGHEDQPFVDLAIFCSKFPFVPPAAFVINNSVNTIDIQ